METCQRFAPDRVIFKRPSVLGKFFSLAQVIVAGQLLSKEYEFLGSTEYDFFCFYVPPEHCCIISLGFSNICNVF